MKSHHALIRIAIAYAPLLATGMAGSAQAQTTTSQATPVVKPPKAASGAASAANPDNMPAKRPQTPTDEKMLRSDPASAAKAK
jgi:hypothetical protein